jgi:hypothetical protein
MNEDVIAAVVRLNESVAFRGDEPLHFARRHLSSPLRTSSAGQDYRHRVNQGQVF